MKFIVISISCLVCSLALSACSLDSRAYDINYQLGPPEIEDQDVSKPATEQATMRPELFNAKVNAMGQMEDNNPEVSAIHSFAPTKGLMFVPLFEAPVANDEERFQRLEDVVQALRNDVDLITIGETSENKKTADEKAAEPIDLKKADTMVEEKPETMQSEKMKEPDFMVASIRMADHKDKTRLVLDITGNSGLKPVITDNGKTLMIKLVNLGWQPKKEWYAESGNLISAYRIENDTLYVDLMYASVISNTVALAPGEETKYHRFLVDLFSKEVHK